MKIFFTEATNPVESRQGITAVDIWTTAYLISIRENGIRIVDNGTKEEVTNTYINLEEKK